MSRQFMQFCVKIIIIEGWVDNIDFSILTNAFFDEALFLKSLTFYKISLNLISSASESP